MKDRVAIRMKEDERQTEGDNQCVSVLVCVSSPRLHSHVNVQNDDDEVDLDHRQKIDPEPA